MQFFRNNYETEKELLLQDFQDDNKNLKNMTAKAQKNLECVYYQLEEETESERNEAHEKYLKQLDDIKAEVS